MNERGMGPNGPRKDDRAARGGPGGRQDGPRGGGRGEGRGRDGGRGGKGRPGGKDREDRGGSAAFRVVNELGSLEKALTKADYAAQKATLDEILRAVRPLRLKAITDLDLNTRGRLITSLARVVRQAKPAAPAAPEGAAPAAEAPAPESAPTEAAATEASPEAPAEAEAAAADAAPAEGAGAAAEGSEAPPAAEAPAAEVPTAEAAKAGPTPLEGWQEVIFSVGCIWQAAGETDRAETAFALSGKPAPSARPVEVSTAQPTEGEGEQRHEGKARGERPDRAAPDWKTQAQNHEDRGRTRDAARLHEKNASWVDAARLFEAGGEPRAALSAAIAGNLTDLAQKLMGLIRAEDVPGILQKAGAWELLMEWYAKRGDFDGVARLYERAKQFDQAALAWERAGKLGQARKAYEKANDTAGAHRVRDLEIAKLVERGDRLGAATVQMHSGLKAEAVATLESLGGPKAYRFMLKLKLEDEAKAMLERELAKAEAEKDLPGRARWLEVKGDLKGAVETWLEAGRKDRAFPLIEQQGDTARAALMAEEAGSLDKAEALYRRAKDTANADRVKALPRPAVPPREPAPDAPATVAQTP